MNDIVPNTSQEYINELTAKIAFLEEENHKLNDTVAWMHDLIWDMYKKLHIPSKR
ncbi:MAG: hypothetical protein IJW18_06265 [Lachnospiraceae bacterium]|nr:hypothetical protein [Lachnospiraceae bacterium]